MKAWKRVQPGCICSRNEPRNRGSITFGKISSARTENKIRDADWRMSVNRGTGRPKWQRRKDRSEQDEEYQKVPKSAKQQHQQKNKIDGIKLIPRYFRNYEISLQKQRSHSARSKTKFDDLQQTSQRLRDVLSVGDIIHSLL